jgi:predicted nucleotidyltransferase
MKSSKTPSTRITKPKTSSRRKVRDSRVGYRVQSPRRAHAKTTRWKIPAVTPVGSQLPVSETLPLAVERIVRELHPEKIILFGSYAYGQPSPDSDVDLMVVMKTDASGTVRAWSVSRLLIPRQFPVDILVRTPREIQSEQANGNLFIGEIVSRGKILYERP